MTGSATRAWKADTATNMTVFMKVEKTCSAITTRRYQKVTPPAGKLEDQNVCGVNQQDVMKRSHMQSEQSDMKL